MRHSYFVVGVFLISGRQAPTSPHFRQLFQYVCSVQPTTYYSVLLYPRNKVCRIVSFFHLELTIQSVLDKFHAKYIGIMYSVLLQVLMLLLFTSYYTMISTSNTVLSVVERILTLHVR